jgi:acyl-CoA synthetase (AMP-forming)/AMP-acid ligase II
MNPLATTLFELFDDNVRARPQATFLIDPDRAWTYADASLEVDRVAGFLHRRAIRPGDRVVVQLRKGVREVAAMLGAARIGAVVVNVNTAWTAEQLLYVVEDSGASAVIAEAPMIRRIEGKLGRSTVLLASGQGRGSKSTSSWDDEPIVADVHAANVLDTDLAAIIYTSGSTGKPKGVMLSHRNILSGARAVARYLDLGSDDRLLSILPYSFDYGFNQLTTMMLMGGSVVHQPVLLPTEILRSITLHGVTGVAAVPPLWIQIVRLLDDAPQNFSSLRFITNSGGKIPRNILERMPEVLPDTRVYLMYGLTEAFRSTYLAPDRFVRKMGAIGQAIPGSQVHVIKHGVGVAGPGEQGELVHRGPLVSMGYWKRHDATAEKIRPCPELAELIGDEPVVYSGDTVRIDEDGDLWFVSRSDALIKSSGFRVSPDDVEDLVHRSGLAADVVAFGVADELLGQTVHVAASLLPGASTEALMAHCRAVMPGYMVPRQIHVWPDPMPRTASGKLARPQVIAHCATLPSPQGRSAETRLQGA